MAGSPIAAALVALLAASPTGAGSPVPAATDAALREIGHVRATTSFCKDALETATIAVNVAMLNDVRLQTSETTLRKTDYDKSDLAKSNGLIDLNRQYVELRAEAVRGNALLKQFKAQAALAPTDEQRRDMLTFADALDGVLGRQRKLADDIGRLVVIMDNHPPIDSFARSELEINALYRSNFIDAYHDPQGPLNDLPYSLGEIAHSAADELVTRAEPIDGDEAKAANAIEPAFTGC